MHGIRVGRGGGWVALALINAGVILSVPAEPRGKFGSGRPWQATLEFDPVLPTV